MAALTAARNTPTRATAGALADYFLCKMKASTTIYAGGLVVVDGTTGLAEPATAAASKVAVGVAEVPPASKIASDGSYTSTSVTSGSTGATYIQVRRGVFFFNNKAADLVTDAMLGQAKAYIEDDNTVRATATASSVAGRVIEVETSGVWVEVY